MCIFALFLWLSVQSFTMHEEHGFDPQMHMNVTHPEESTVRYCPKELYRFAFWLCCSGWAVIGVGVLIAGGVWLLGAGGDAGA
jgi:hypothetical protein